MAPKIVLPIPVQGGLIKRKGRLREYIEALLTAFLIAFVIRSFVIEAFKIPSASMVPTLMIGDHLFVNKFIYGLRIPFTKKKILHVREPKRGEPIVFIYPIDESKDFIKRVVGLPGDHIKIKGDDIWVNDQPIARQSVPLEPNQEGQFTNLKAVPEANASETPVTSIPYFRDWEEYNFFTEQLGDTRHLVQFDKNPSAEEMEIVVPESHLFVMGDNRDNSSDSRDWGFVPMENVKGKAMFIWLSIDYDRKNLRWNRFGKMIH